MSKLHHIIISNDCRHRLCLSCSVVQFVLVLPVLPAPHRAADRNCLKHRRWVFYSNAR